MDMNFRLLDGEASCSRCCKGYMKIFSVVNDKRFIMECDYCGCKDDLEFVNEDEKIKIVMRKLF